MTDRLAVPAIREAAVGDAAALAGLKIAIWREAYREILPQELLDGLDPVREQEGWGEAIRRRPESWQIWVAEAGGQAIGYCRAGRELHQSEIYALYVDPQWRGRRLGRRLLTVAAEWLMPADPLPLTVWASSGNLAAQGFYRRLGGQPSGERQVPYSGHILREAGFRWARAGDLRRHTMG
jgi:ribosomal protein S18 acetylase RimI-like enzyme